MDKEGLFEMAEGGSLLLDEIGEMPPYLQTKLLRVLQEREYRPIGSDRIVHVDFRLICATNIDLDAALRDGRLREDLYFRINTITLRVPPLRERTEDIPLLCDYFLDKFRQRYQKNVQDAGAGGLPPADPQPLAGQRARARERDRARGAGREGHARSRSPICRSRSARSRPASTDFVDPAAPHARRDREDGDPADAAAHELEQAGGGADPRALSADALQQDEEARHPRRRQIRASRRRSRPRRSRTLTPRSHQARASAGVPVMDDARRRPDGTRRREKSALAAAAQARRGT